MQTPFAPIRGIQGMQSPMPLQAPGLSLAPTSSAPSAEEARSFGNMLGDALNNVSTTLETSKAMTRNLMSGDLENLHEMSIAGAKSEVMLHLTTQIASKLSSATTTLFQMQL